VKKSYFLMNLLYMTVQACSTLFSPGKVTMKLPIARSAGIVTDEELVQACYTEILLSICQYASASCDKLRY
jgi:hypothetical protein